MLFESLMESLNDEGVVAAEVVVWPDGERRLRTKTRRGSIRTVSLMSYSFVSAARHIKKNYRPTAHH